MRIVVLGWDIDIQARWFRREVIRVIKTEGEIAAIKFVRQEQQGRPLGNLMAARVYVGEIMGKDMSVHRKVHDNGLLKSVRKQARARGL